MEICDLIVFFFNIYIDFLKLLSEFNYIYSCTMIVTTQFCEKINSWFNPPKKTIQ